MRTLFAVVTAAMLGGCASDPLLPYTADTTPLVLFPAVDAGVRDGRARFREIYCGVLEARRNELPDYRPCDEALTRIGREPAPTGTPVDLGPSHRRLAAAVVSGLAYDCFEPWLEPPGTVTAHLAKQGYESAWVPVEGLSSSRRNALLIRDAIMGRPAEPGARRIVLIGYSKGAPDILEALVAYPELRQRVAAVVTVAGAVGGSALANGLEQYEANLLRHFPGARCPAGDGGAIASLRPEARKAWLAANPLPRDVCYYSVVTFPQPDRISTILKSYHSKLASVDARNDSQLLFYDQVVPGSTLVGYINADHLAVAMPVARTHPTVGSTLLTQNAYPREALVEAILRFVEEDLGAAPSRTTSPEKSFQTTAPASGSGCRVEGAPAEIDLASPTE